VTPVASRNVVNILIFVGLLPILLWLFLLALSLLHPEGFLPWVSAGIIMFGVPLGMLSVFIALPMMLLARNRAVANPTLWTRFHRLPFFFGVASFVVAVIAGIWLVSNNLRRGEAGQPESMKTMAAFEVPLPSEADRDQFLSVLRAAAEMEGMHVDATSKGDLEQEAKVSPNFQMTMNAAVWRGSNDDEAVASAMDQFDHLGQVWLMFSRGEDPEMAARFRERAMHEIILHWPSTLSLPIMPTGAIPLHRDLIRTPTGYIVNPSEAHKYQLGGAESQPHR
jgi:hypothetical protein